MISIKKIVIGIALLNLVAIGILLHYSTNRLNQTLLINQIHNNSTKLLINEKVDNPKKVYRFDSPSLAWYILNELDQHIPLPDEYGDIITSKGYHGIMRDDHYCKKSRAYFTDHSEYIFLQQNFLTDFLLSSLPRKLVMNVIGRDMHPNIGYHVPKNLANKTVYDLLPNINSIYLNAGMHYYYYLDKHFGCSPHQLYNHIYGIYSLNSKAEVAEYYQVYYNSYKSRPHCVPEFMPEAFMMKNKTQCLEFFKIINSQEYKDLRAKYNILYVKKLGLGSHRGEGVFPFDDIQEKILREDYKEGAVCGKNHTSIQMQKYIINPLLLDGHKFDFRIYMLIASTNPLVLYYHDGFLRVSLYEYDPFSDEKAVHLTNTDISKKIFKEAHNGTWNGMNETELRNFQMWNFTKLQNYLLDHGKIQNNDWLDTGLRPQIQRAMAHIGRFTSQTFINRSNTYELFGIDFILDDNLKLWFIECNTGPVLDGTSEEKEKFITKMLIDHFEIVFGYLRSRIKRIINFINEISKEIPREDIYFDKVIIPDIKAKRLKYLELNKNYLEDEFKPNNTNGFTKIIDHNLQGPERYAGYIPVDCYE